MGSIIPFLTSYKYHIGFIDKEYLFDNPRDRFCHVKWLDLGDYKEGWFADPFIYYYDSNSVVLFAEEFVYKSQKGRLSQLDISIKGGRYVLERVKTILELPTHLSFPYIYLADSEVFVLPENSQSGKTLLYRYDLSEERLVEGTVLVEYPLLDSCIFNAGEHYYLIGTDCMNNQPNITKYAEVFISESLFGPYHHIQTLMNNERIERGAGGVFISEDGYYVRPTQFCNKRYGQYVLFNQLEFDGLLISEKTIFNLEPDYKQSRGYCLHTFNSYDNLCVIDGMSYRFPHIGPLLISLLNKLAAIYR